MSSEEDEGTSGSVTEIEWWLRGYVREASRQGWNLSRQVSAVIEAFEAYRDLSSTSKQRDPYQMINLRQIDYTVTISDDSDEAEAGSFEDLRESQRTESKPKDINAKILVKEEPVEATDDNNVQLSELNVEKHRESPARPRGTEHLLPTQKVSLQSRFPTKIMSDIEEGSHEESENLLTNIDMSPKCGLVLLPLNGKDSILNQQHETSCALREVPINQNNCDSKINNLYVTGLHSSSFLQNTAISNQEPQASLKQIRIKQERCDNTSIVYSNRDVSEELLATQKLPSPKRRTRIDPTTMPHMSWTIKNESNNNHLQHSLLTQAIPSHRQHNQHTVELVVKNKAKENLAQTTGLPCNARKLSPRFSEIPKVRPGHSNSYISYDKLTKKLEWNSQITIAAYNNICSARSQTKSLLDKNLSNSDIDVADASCEDNATQLLDYPFSRIKSLDNATTSLTDLPLVSLDEPWVEGDETRDFGQEDTHLLR
ncbi:uncharacterized protein LOC111245253 [Varroa destructor]|uniref:Uncharacterized protein n=1 Tax=Varroa destructor TaxID=109461 RepID=A0A7M7JAI3_VARDE|nr:uncharacterized protein LOC111245253 [Varroa destructor]XP_022649106.1 uncharacterized protein LOC111245253 [Varroa destructor]XP_022649107.1 uncharacterized protein LOC111245253 [Varroa destructor]XP_022649108.1 uncharacterized protein LOC111245253 [Varroa destructor]XP_022649109.1 uncharacterized protein LOC111245253 [Varroa destructor]